MFGIRKALSKSTSSRSASPPRVEEEPQSASIANQAANTEDNTNQEGLLTLWENGMPGEIPGEKRFCTIQGSCLCHWPSKAESLMEDAEEVKKSIPLSTAHLRLFPISGVEQYLFFELATDDNVYLCKAASEQEVRKWMASLQQESHDYSSMIEMAMVDLCIFNLEKQRAVACETEFLDMLAKGVPLHQAADSAAALYPSLKAIPTDEVQVNDKAVADITTANIVGNGSPEGEEEGASTTQCSSGLAELVDGDVFNTSDLSPNSGSSLAGASSSSPRRSQISKNKTMLRRVASSPGSLLIK